MHTRRLVALLLGFWLAGLIIAGWTALQSVQTSAVIAANIPAEVSRAFPDPADPTAARFVRFVGSEINRSILDSWGWLEIFLTASIAIAVFFAGHGKRATILAVMMFVSALGSHLLLTPQIVSRGRIADFRDPDAAQPDRGLHVFFGAVTLFRLACGATLGGLLLYRGDQSRLRRRRTDDVNAIHNAEHSHIDR